MLDDLDPYRNSTRYAASELQPGRFHVVRSWREPAQRSRYFLSPPWETLRAAERHAQHHAIHDGSLSSALIVEALMEVWPRRNS